MVGFLVLTKWGLKMVGIQKKVAYWFVMLLVVSISAQTSFAESDCDKLEFEGCDELGEATPSGELLSCFEHKCVDEAGVYECPSGATSQRQYEETVNVLVPATEHMTGNTSYGSIGTTVCEQYKDCQDGDTCWDILGLHRCQVENMAWQNQLTVAVLQANGDPCPDAE